MNSPAAVTLRHWANLWCTLEWAYRGAPPFASQEGTFHSTGYRAWLLEGGSGELAWSPEGHGKLARHRLLPDEWLFIPPGTGTQRFTPDSRLLSISFYARWPAGQPLLVAPKPVGFPAEQDPALTAKGLALARACRRRMPDAPHRFPDEQSALDEMCRINTALYTWLGAFAGAALEAGWKLTFPHAPDVDDERVAIALRIAEEHPLDQPFRLAAVARTCGLSVSQLARLFRDRHGRTPGALVEERRLHRARRLVEGSRLEFKEIAYELGFRHSSHFTAWFRRQTGITPTAARSGTDNE